MSHRHALQLAVSITVPEDEGSYSLLGFTHTYF